MNSKTNLKKILVIGLFIAINIILVRFLKIEMPMLRIDFGFLPIAILGILYGPIWAGVAGILSDLLGIAIVMPPNPFFGFTLTAFLTGAFFGIVFHKKKITYPRCIIAVLLVCIVCNLCLDTFWLHILYDKALLGMLPFRLLKIAVMIPIEVILIYNIWNKLLSKLKIV